MKMNLKLAQKYRNLTIQAKVVSSLKAICEVLNCCLNFNYGKL
jgi:hypothetical protein